MVYVIGDLGHSSYLYSGFAASITGRDPHHNLYFLPPNMLFGYGYSTTYGPLVTPLDGIMHCTCALNGLLREIAFLARTVPRLKLVLRMYRSHGLQCRYMVLYSRKRGHGSFPVFAEPEVSEQLAGHGVHQHRVRSSENSMVQFHRARCKHGCRRHEVTTDTYPRRRIRLAHNT